ncbi:hypothetical protein [Bythopirellula goksoeyrii]|uniref:Uncharacterized protein n=1 Tax=Bythopirellula goksoeyrii TaxID=1400387 RepID=A0A5B9QJT8_9BACT|nr:hypothetical protein [Bythopirellula goksoeyrii]QEG34421.1 hypothetical protein Pr1d_17000 [Bythopirellula goksoeyrii]
MYKVTPLICVVAILCHIALFIGEMGKVVLWEDVVFWLVVFPTPMAVLGVMSYLEQKSWLPLFTASFLLTSLYLYHIIIYFTKGIDSQGGMGLVVLGIFQWGVVLLLLIAEALRKCLRRKTRN